MKWSETTASECRYGGVAERIWGEWNILWEDSEADYQGHACFLAEKAGAYCFYEWNYGSCSGCDAWEGDDLSDDAIEVEMRKTAMWFNNRVHLESWLTLIEDARREKRDIEGAFYQIDPVAMRAALGAT